MSNKMNKLIFDFFKNIFKCHIDLNRTQTYKVIKGYKQLKKNRFIGRYFISVINI
ncbi:hypothetical protein FACS189413_04380 [Bacteroidia bacterium]|nr:hypothetical protein FACS189413_04380 [Bacteroidia bacterium]